MEGKGMSRLETDIFYRELLLDFERLGDDQFSIRPDHPYYGHTWDSWLWLDPEVEAKAKHEQRMKARRAKLRAAQREIDRLEYAANAIKQKRRELAECKRPDAQLKQMRQEAEAAQPPVRERSPLERLQDEAIDAAFRRRLVVSHEQNARNKDDTVSQASAVAFGWVFKPKGG